MEAKDKEYDKSMDMAAGQLSQLNDCLARIGFEKGTVKTTDFNVKIDYDSRKDRQRTYQRVFSGFVCSHQLKLSFDFDMKKLSRALAVIAAHKMELIRVENSYAKRYQHIKGILEAYFMIQH